jgi:hypothetical protein
MPIFEIQGPDGKIYEAEAPDAQTAARAFSQMASLDTSKPSLNTADVKAAAQGWAGKTPELPGYAGVEDLAKSAGIGLVQGGIGLASLPATLEALGRKGVNLVGGNVSEEPANPFTYGNIKGAIEGVTGEFYEPKSTAGEYARTLGEFAPGMIGGGSMAAKGLSTALGAITSETAGQATKGTSAEPWARAIGGVAGAVAPSVAARTAAPIKQVGADGAERARLATILDAENIPLTAGQRTGSKPLRWAESVANDTPFSGGRASKVQEAQREAFTKAALGRIGEDATRATPEVMAAARTRIGAAFDDFAKGREVKFDSRAADKLEQAWESYTGAVAPSHQVPNVARSLEDFQPAIDAVKKGETPIVSAAQYSSWRSDLTARLGKTTDDNARTALRDMINALDDALERSVEPAARESIKEARRQYKHLVTLEKTVASAGEDAAQGLISPQVLANKVTANDAGKRAYAQGKGDFADLARAGRGLLKELPNSGTQPRANAANMLALGLGVGVNPLAMVAPALTARGVMSKPVQAYLANALRGQQYMAGKQGAPMAGVKGTIADVLADEEWQPLTHRSKYRTD